MSIYIPPPQTPSLEKPRVNGSFSKTGTFLALPLCYPGVNKPIPYDESWIERLSLSTSGDRVYGWTRGPVPHLFMALPKAPYGYVVDLPIPDSAERIVDCLPIPTEKRRVDLLVIAAVEGHQARLWMKHSPVYTHGIQEWGVWHHRPLSELTLEGGTAISLHRSPAGASLLVTGESTASLYNIESNTLQLEDVIELPSTSFLRPVSVQDSDVHLVSPEGGLWRWSWEEKKWGEYGHAAPSENAHWTLAAPAKNGLLLADSQGHIVQIDSRGGRHRGQVPIPPVRCMVGLKDDRIFGICGHEIGHCFQAGTAQEWALDHGIPVSVLSDPRYGHEFSHAAVGPDGQIYLAEYDRGGRLWIYFPPMPPDEERGLGG